MSHTNIEIKARCNDPTSIRQYLQSHGEFKGIDHQIDTYFHTRLGRLKLREGNIENALIYYDREDKEGPKQSNVMLYQTNSDSNLKQLLEKALGIQCVVDKQREIYFIENVKFHIDEVKGLGSFVEFEAIDLTGNIGRERLVEQCTLYLRKFKIQAHEYVTCSYSDLIKKS